MSTLVTPVFRVSYPKVFKPELNQLSGQEEFSIVALFPKGANLDALKKAAQAAVQAKWPDPKKIPKNLRSPFRDQGDRAKENDLGVEVLPPGMEKGAIYMNLKSKQRPGVVDRNAQPMMDESELYAGCFAQAAVRAYAYDNKGNAGVSFGLQHIQKVREGDTLGSRTKPEDHFAPITTVEGEGDATADATSLFG